MKTTRLFAAILLMVFAYYSCSEKKELELNSQKSAETSGEGGATIDTNLLINDFRVLGDGGLLFYYNGEYLDYRDVYLGKNDEAIELADSICLRFDSTQEFEKIIQSTGRRVLNYMPFNASNFNFTDSIIIGRSLFINSQAILKDSLIANHASKNITWHINSFLKDSTNLLGLCTGRYIALPQKYEDYTFTLRLTNN